MMFLEFALGTMLVFLVGVLVIAKVVAVRHADQAASYDLFAVRDRLVGAVVFDGVPRDDAWLQGLYTSVNAILTGSNLIAGPGRGWTRAHFVGRALAGTTRLRVDPPSLPTTPPPRQLLPIVDSLQSCPG